MGNDMKIIRATIVTGAGRLDRISLETDLPSAYTYNPENGPLFLSSEASPGRGVEYVRVHFPDIPICVIDGRDGTQGCVG